MINGRECSHVICGIRCEVRAGNVRVDSHVCGSACISFGRCQWRPFEPAVPATPTCACGKPGSYRGDPDKGYQTMKCPDCCARQEVVAAIKAAEPPSWVNALTNHLDAALYDVNLADDNASCCVPWVREVIQEQMGVAKAAIQRAREALNRGPKP